MTLEQAPFVCLHGFTGTPDAFTPLGIAGPPLGGPRHDSHWAPRLTGHGPDPDLSSQTFDDEVARISREIAKRTEVPVRLVGYSMGARVALGLLDAHPHLFTDATLVGVNPGLESEEARQDRLGWEARWIDVLEQDGLAVFEHQWSAQPIFKTQYTIPPRSQDAQRSARLSHTALGLVHALNVLGLGSMPNLWPRLGHMKVPMTFVYGALDDKFRKIAERAQTENAQIRIVAIPDVGHNPLLEAPEFISRLLTHS